MPKMDEIGILRLITRHSRVETIGDELLAAGAALFMACCFHSFWSFKTKNGRAGPRSGALRPRPAVRARERSQGPYRIAGMDTRGGLSSVRYTAVSCCRPVSSGLSFGAPGDARNGNGLVRRRPRVLRSGRPCCPRRTGRARSHCRGRPSPSASRQQTLRGRRIESRK
jgi:hypothetical protein